VLPATATVCPHVAGVGLAGEFVVVQGIADLVVLLDEEIWLLDFKTDDVKGTELQARAQEYEPQLRLYALALERIYQRPVTRRWLHFLSVGETATMEQQGSETGVVLRCQRASRTGGRAGGITAGDSC